MTIWASRYFYTIHLWITAILLSDVYCNESLNDRLLKDLWKNYQSDVRPICDSYPSPVPTTIGIAMRQLVDMNEPEQKLSTSIWFRMAWHDCRLEWTPSDYDNITRVTVPRHRMWVPDITLYDNAESKLGEQEEYWVSFSYTGTVFYNLPAVVMSMCQLDVSMFPFDKQTCYLTLGSWTYNDNELNLKARETNAADMSSYIRHGEWDLHQLDVQNHSIDGYDGVTYSQVIFTIHLKRKPLFHTVNLILPSLLVEMLAVIGFLVPAESGEKLNLEITVLLSLLVFQLVIINNMPHSSENMPVLAIYFLLSMIVISLSCLCTVIILNLHYSKHHRPLPKWIRNILAGRLGKLFHVDDLIKKAHEKHMRLLGETGKSKPKKPSSASAGQRYASPPMKKSMSSNSASAAYTNGGFTKKSPFSRQQSKIEDDSVYGFYPQSNAAYSNYTDPPIGRFSAPTSPTHSVYFTMTNMSETRRRESEPREGEHPTIAVTRRILGHMEHIIARENKKRLNDVLDTEWKIFAIFLDRVFLFTFLAMGIIVGAGTYGFIAS